MLNSIDSLSVSLYKLKAIVDLLGSPQDERQLQEMTLRWISILLMDELEKMESALESIDWNRKIFSA